MRFSKVIGIEKGSAEEVRKAEEMLSALFLELNTGYTNTAFGTKLGGDPLVFTLLYSVPHICTYNMPTAATDGTQYFWNPAFLLKLGKLGVRLVMAHEAWHAIYMHPQRRGSRLPWLWNIAVDFLVNHTVMADLRNRKFNPEEVFRKNLGDYITLKEYSEILKDPENPPAKFKDDKKKLFFADPALPEDMKRPEVIYDLLYKILPRCPECNRLGVYHKKNDKKKDKNKDKKSKDKKLDSKSDKSNQKAPGEEEKDGEGQPKEEHDHGSGNPCDCPNHSGEGSDSGEGEGQGEGEGEGQGEGDGQGQGCGSGKGKGCGTCDGGYVFDPSGFGATLDDHLDTEADEEVLAKRIADAIETASKMAGSVPGALQDELGKLLEPKLTWKDFIRVKMKAARDGNGKNDWTRPRTRPLATGMYVPKRRNVFCRFHCLLDCSGSMSKSDITYGVSQLKALDERTEGNIVPADVGVYWEDAVKIRKANEEELTKIKVVGRGGTMFGAFFNDYEENLGPADFLIVITDGYLGDISDLKDPKIDVVWIITNPTAFAPPFGRVFNLDDS